MASPPLVSVVIPVFNGERYLAESIESVFAQTRDDLELILVDDGSTDGSREIAGRYDATLLLQDRGGPGVARNLGVAHARGKYLAFLDHDDVWVPEKLEWQLDLLASDPAIDLLFGHVQNFVSPDLDPAEAARIECPPDPLPGPLPATMLVETETFRSVGEFGTSDRYIAEFLDWLVLADRRSLRQVMMPEVLMWRRLHETNQHRVNPAGRQDYVKSLKTMLDQRRAGEAT
jgi:glycosyltransferase involved in cell wall biosynthesis